ncbi:MAG TPA: ATP-grasp domain-containing protein [Usitatibacteraceae bacterium]|nr:ATP-grasp domain-containing protein [Usitatibacteraceae bacterium]
MNFHDGKPNPGARPAMRPDPMTRKRLLVLFPDEWDRSMAARRDGVHDFLFEGFDLFRFPDNARLFTFDVARFVDRLERRYASAGLDGILTSDEQFGPVVASLLGERLGLPHNPIRAVLTAQHKYYARLAFERSLPECNPRFCLVVRDFRHTRELPLAFPLYVKPVKAAFSVLARRIDSFDALDRHARFSWFEQAIIERLVKPFGDVMRAHAGFDVEPFTMIAEELIDGVQVTVNGFARAGAVTMLGVIDSIMYPGTDQFQRFQYPSALPRELQSGAEEVARRALAAVGFTHGMFNVELRLCTSTGLAKVIEINPRAAGQFYDLFERVDGYNLFDALVALETGGEPAIRHRQGRDAFAASFVLRDLEGAGLGRWPARGEIGRLRARHPEATIMFYPKRGADLRREMKWLGSYRYGVVNLGAPTLGELFANYGRIHRDIAFHPRGQESSRVDEMLGEAAAD